MAEQLSSNGEAPEMGHNLKETKEVVAAAVHEIIQHEARIAAIREEITEVRGRNKGCGIKMKDFAVAKRLYELEGDERHEALDNIRVCCEALGVGEQGDLFPASPEPPETA